MRKIIDGKLYDTDTARLVGSWSNELWKDQINLVEEDLYRKRTGEYFVCGRGGANTRYAVSRGDDGWKGGERIMPVSPGGAREWAEEKLDADAYEAEFGVPDEGDGHVMTVTVSEASYRAIKDLAASEGATLGAAVDAAIRAYTA